MKICHTEPCAECPWRKDSLQGYLGGHPAEYYADAVAEGVIPACHMKDFGPEDDRTAYCAGAASVLANSAKMAEQREPGQEEAEAMRKTVGKRGDTFFHPMVFYKYHTGEDYVMPLMRRLGVDA